MSKAKILHINATPEFLADPEKMAMLQKMADIAYGRVKKKPGRKAEGSHIWDDYDTDELAHKCSVCGVLKKEKKHWNKSGTKILGHYSVYMVYGKWVDEWPECKNKK